MKKYLFTFPTVKMSLWKQLNKAGNQFLAYTALALLQKVTYYSYTISVLNSCEIICTDLLSLLNDFYKHDVKLYCVVLLRQHIPQNVNRKYSIITAKNQILQLVHGTFRSNVCKVHSWHTFHKHTFQTWVVH